MSLKVTENGTIRKLGYGFLFAFDSNFGGSSFDTIHECDRHPANQPANARRHNSDNGGINVDDHDLPPAVIHRH